MFTIFIHLFRPVATVSHLDVVANGRQRDTKLGYARTSL
jgi:hypothetical protein